MHRKSVSELEPDEFEWVCGGIIGDIAADCRRSPSGSPETMAPTNDGGIEAKVQTVTGYVAVQCKKYVDFGKEIDSIKSSFTRFLDCSDHSDVTMYVWCSSASRTSSTKRGTGKEVKASQAIEDMLKEAEAKGRDVTVEIRFAEDLDRVIREYRPEYFAVMSALQQISYDDVKRYSTARAAEILSRLGGDEVPRLQFPTLRTSDFLERLMALSTPPSLVQTLEIDDLLDEVERRADRIPSVWSSDRNFCVGARRMLEAALPLRGRISTPAMQLQEPLSTLHAVAQSTFDGAMSLLNAPPVASLNPLNDSQQRLTIEIILDYVKSVKALLQHLNLVLCLIEAAVARRLLITGKWGTGKSYQLAVHADRALSYGTPVLLLRARDFTLPDKPVLSQPWRGNFDNLNAEPTAFAAMLDAIGHRAVRDGSGPLVLIIDGLNESGIRNLPSAMQRLQEMIDKFPNIRLIVSTRRDRIPPDDSSMPELLHMAPDRTTISRSVEQALNAPPGTAWNTALTNPLLASVAVRLLSDRPQESERLVSTSSIFEAWGDLLSGEAASAILLPEATIRRVIEKIADADGQCTIPDLAAAARLHSDQVDFIVQRLADEGLLEISSSGGDSVRFHWEMMRDIQRAKRAIDTDAIDEFLRGLKEDRKLSLLELIAEALPQKMPSYELLDVSITSVSDAHRNMAFALSLSSRADDGVYPGTLQHAKRLLLEGGDVSQAIVRSVLSSPRRRKLSFEWLSEQLRESTLAQRTRFWPCTIEDLCERSQIDQQDMENLLSWYATDFWRALSEEEAGPAVEILAWMACADLPTALPAYAIRSMTEVLHKYPDQLEVVLKRLSHVDDDHPRDALYSAAAGVIARWPQSETAGVIRSICTRALKGGARSHSFRSLAAIYSAIGSGQAFHKFLRQSLPLIEQNRLFRVRDLIGYDDRAMFADGRSIREAEKFETAILDSFRVPKRQRKVIFDTHGRSLLRGRWLAQQYANYPVGGRISRLSTGPIKAGTPENPSARYLNHPDEAWDLYVDPTVPLELMLSGSDVVYPDTWWAVREAPDTELASVLEVRDAEGVEWIVIDGCFRMLEPPLETSEERPKLRIGRRRWMFSSRDDGKPLSGQSRHDFIRVSNSLLTPSPSADTGGVSRSSNRRARFADSFACNAPDGALIDRSVDAGIDPLTAELLQLIGATWTGWGLNCVDSTGQLVIYDPAVGRGAAHAVLVRRDRLFRNLDRTGQQLTVELEIRNLHLSGNKRDEPICVTFG